MLRPPRPRPTGEAPTAYRRDTPEALVALYSPYVARIAFRMLGRDGEVDDVVQDVFAIVLRKLPRIQPDASVRHWLASITVKRCHQILRWRRVRAFRTPASDVDYESIPDREASLESRDLVTRLARLLDTLPPAQKIAWLLRYLEGEPLEDVARICGCSLATAKRRISAAQERVREVLGDE